jgi:hypothetical protein
MSDIFSIESTPPTEPEIKDAFGNARLKLRCQMLFMLVLSGTLVGLLFHSGMTPALFLGIVLSSAGTLVFCLVNDLSEYEVLEESDCAEMMKLCEKTPEGRAYRKAVISQARKFAKGELTAMEAWVKNTETRDACKKLYEIPTEA